MQYHELFFLILAFTSEIFGNLSGVSSSSLFVPVGVFFESVQLTLVLTACLHVIGNLIRIIMYWHSIDWKLAYKFGVPSIVMAAIGAYVSGFLPKTLFSVILGVFLISISILFWMIKEIDLSTKKSTSYFGGGLSGFLTGALGSGGAIRSLALAAFNLSPVVFTATSTLIDFGGDILRLQIYLHQEYLDRAHYFYVPAFMVVAFIANLIAKKWLTKIDKNFFRKTVLGFVFLAGLVSILTGVSTWRSS